MIRSCLLVLPFFLTGCDQPAPAQQPPISVYFSPNGGCTDAVVAEIEKAQRSVKVQA